MGYFFLSLQPAEQSPSLMVTMHRAQILCLDLSLSRDEKYSINVAGDYIKPGFLPQKHSSGA